jgi:hypothetical protein
MTIDPQDIGTSRDPSTSGPLETKVAASAGGAGVGGALAALLLYLLDMIVYDGGKWGESVPGVVTTAVVVVFAALGALVAGYRAPHTARPPTGR